jgi:hypothetical protein
VQGLCISWRTLPLITSRLFAIHIKKLSCFKLGNTQFWGPSLVFRPTPLGYHPQGRDHQIMRGPHEQAIPQYITSKEHIVYLCKEEMCFSRRFDVWLSFPKLFWQTWRASARMKEWRAWNKC